MDSAADGSMSKIDRTTVLELQEIASRYQEIEARVDEANVGLNPLGIVAAGLVLALTYLGGEAAQIALGLSDKAVRVFQGMLLFFVLATDTLIHYQVRITGGAAAGDQS